MINVCEFSDFNKLANINQGSKFLGFWMSGTPKNGDGNTILGTGFQTGNPGIVRETYSLTLGFSDRKPRNC